MQKNLKEYAKFKIQQLLFEAQCGETRNLFQFQDSFIPSTTPIHTRLTATLHAPQRPNLQAPHSSVSPSFQSPTYRCAHQFSQLQEIFCKQCTPVANDITLPKLLKTPNETLSSLEIIASDIGKIIKALKVKKAHGHDEISIRMLKLCESAITEPLYLIFKNCLSSNTFPDVWKKANVIPLHKKGDKQVLKNYRPVPLLPVCGKIFEKLIFNASYSFFEDHKLLNPCQSGFSKNNSCINQLVSITHKI